MGLLLAWHIECARWQLISNHYSFPPALLFPSLAAGSLAERGSNPPVMATTIIPGAGPNLSALRADIAALVPHSLVLFTQQRTLNPLYGSYLTLFSLNAVVSAATLISVLKPFGVKKDRNWLVAGLLLSVAPNASYWIAVLGGRQKWLTLGPVLAHIAAVAPLTLTFTELVVQVCVGCYNHCHL